MKLSANDDLSNFFDDAKNLYFVGGGLGMVTLAVVIGLLICKKAENRKGKGLLEGNDSD